MFTNSLSASLISLVWISAVSNSGISGAGSEAMMLVHQLMLLDSHECVCMQPLKGIHYAQKYKSLNLDLSNIGALEESSCLFLP